MGVKKLRLTEEPIRMLGLIRVSTVGQADDDRGGIPAQRKAIDRVVEWHGGSLLESYELIIGGPYVQRHGVWINEILPKLDGRTHLVVSNQDRLLRPENFDASILAVVRDRGAKIYHPGGVIDLSNEWDATMAQYAAIEAGRERARIKKRTMAWALTKIPPDLLTKNLPLSWLFFAGFRSFSCVWIGPTSHGGRGT